MKKIITLLINLSIVQVTVAQNFNQITNQDDVSSFLGAYFSPFANTLGAGLNNGWYNTAKPHKLGGFDVSLGFNMVSVSDNFQSFNPNDLANFSSSSSSTPTSMGEGNGANIIYNVNGQEIPFKMPNQNTALPMLPIPTLNAGVGLIKSTEINVRYIPKYNFDIGFIGEGSIDLLGFGLKHDILQWIPVANKLPFDLSVQAGITNLKTAFEFENNDVKQDLELSVLAQNYNLIISKKFLMLTGHASVGYQRSSTNFSSNTYFNLGEGASSLSFNVPSEIKFDPSSGIRANVGARFQLAILTIYANHTFSNYPITTAGIGISFR